ncbi:MAG: serine hydrolase [Bryobacterales bacterium]|nr:serine hydrolase [Bryobacterales bacterium]
MKQLTTLTILLVLLALGCSSGLEPDAPAAGEIPKVDPAQVGLSQERLDRITAALQADVERGHLAGAIGVVARRGKIGYWQTVGMADRENGRAMSDDTIFRIYSMTKPIVGVGLMTLYEEGRFNLRDRVRNYIPELGGLEVLDGDGTTKARREMTVQDLMRHTAGMGYGGGDTAADKKFRELDVLGGNRSIDDFIQKLAQVPLKHHPGSAWEYSVSVDVQGRLIEVLSGQDLDTFLNERVFGPLDMRDTGFTVPDEKKDRFVQMYAKTEDGEGIEPASADRSTGYYDYESKWFSGGGGLVSTTRDYLRFCQMMLNGGMLGDQRILSRKTIELMTRDHVEGVRRASRTLSDGYGFGLDFAVHVDKAKSGLNGSLGEYNWGGLAGTIFWIDPTEEMIGLYMIQLLPPRFGDGRGQFKRLAYQAIAD